MSSPGEPWLQITVIAEHPELVEAVFEAQGATAVTLRGGDDEALIEPSPGAAPLWQSTEVSGLFSAATDPQGIVRAVTAGLKRRQPPAWRAELIEDRDWVRAWLDDYRPMRFGQRLWVCPKTQTVNAPQAVAVHLDPGLAFGTGNHPSTALCLEWLDAHPPHAARVIDYGCGSGILGIAAARLGAARVWATDIDAQALTATRDNAGTNGVADRVQACAAGALPQAGADLLLANILAAPLLELAPALAGLVAENGRLILAGLLADQARDVQDAYLPWFDFDWQETREGWLRLDGIRNDRIVSY